MQENGENGETNSSNKGENFRQTWKILKNGKSKHKGNQKQERKWIKKIQILFY